MAFWLMIAGALGSGGVVASNPVLWRRSPDGLRLWRRHVRTQREDLRLGAALLLVAATAIALVGVFAFNSDSQPSSSGTTATEQVSAVDNDANWDQGSLTSATLIILASGAMARSCSADSTRRLVSYE